MTETRKRVGFFYGGKTPKADYERILGILERLRGRPFQVRDFVRMAVGTTNRSHPQYHMYEARFFILLRCGAIKVLKIGGQERGRYRFYEVADVNKWKPKLLKERRKRTITNIAAALATKSARGTLTSKDMRTAIDQLIVAKLNELGVTGGGRRGGVFGEYTFCLVRAEDVRRADPVAILELSAEDKLHSWGRAENEYLRDYLILSSSRALPSIPKWRDLGIEIVGTVKARSKSEAEGELLALVTSPNAS